MANKIKSGAIYFMITSDFIRFSVHLSLPAYMPRLCPGYSSQVTLLSQETQDHPRLIPATCYFHLQKNQPMKCGIHHRFSVSNLTVE